MKTFLSIAFVLGLTTAPLLAQNSRLLLDSNFDNADLSGWRVAGDLCVAPSFCAGEAPGRYWVALSTNNEEDPITMCGTSSVGGLETILRSPDVSLPFKPARIRVNFKVKFLTNENTATDLGTDALIVKLLTMAGPVVIAAFDDAGPSPETMNLKISGDSQFRESRCNPTWKYETGLLQVSYYRAFREPALSKIAGGPVALEFSLGNHFDGDFDSAVIIDDIQLRVYP